MFPADAINGRDMWIAGNTYFDRREFDGRPTYHWDRRGTNHVSRHETNRGTTASERFAIAENYWRLKIAARDSVLQTVHIAA